MPGNPDDTIECPWCGEDIRKKAILCRFCKGDVTPRGLEAAQRFMAGEEAPPPPEPEVPGARAAAASGEGLREMSDSMPASLLDQIVTASESIDEGERRPITVVFTDLCGFTRLTASIGAERMNEILDLIYAESREIVSYYGGVIEKFIGDAVMAVFGAVQAHGDDPERAIRSALDIRDAIRKIGKAEGLALDAHSGVAFGEVIFTKRGVGGNFDYRSIGDAVNLASRLEGAADDGETLTDHRIYQQTRTVFDWEDLEPLAVRGKKEPVIAHKVVGIRKRFSHARLGERIEMAPMVGRREELARLVRASIEVVDGRRRVVWLEGESGVGKSRLVYEFYQTFERDKWHWFTGRCLSYGKNTPFFPFLELFRAMLFFSENSDEEVTRENLEELVERVYASALEGARAPESKQEIAGKRDAATAALAVLLGIQLERNPLLELTPRERRERLFAAVTDLIGRLADERPTVLVFEDFQWADEDSRELLVELMTQLRDHSVLFLVAARNEPGDALPLQDGFVHVVLRELSEDDSVDLLHRLLGVAELPRRLRERILEKTAGNPFYLEEIVLSLEEHGDIRREGKGYRLMRPIDTVEIPDTVEGVVLARLDRLERTVRTVLQCASVIGQEFRREILSQVAEIGQRLRDHLFSLVEDDYVLQQALIPEMVYAFRHLVLRDVAYGTLLEKRRRQYHAQAAEAIEVLFPNRLDEYVELLAHHYRLAEVMDKAIHYLERAAIKAENLYANYTAAECWEQLLTCLDHPKAALDGADHRERRMLRARACVGYPHVCQGLGELCRKLGRPRRGVEVYELGRSTAEALGDERGAIMALRGLGEAYRLDGDIEKAVSSIHEARRRAEETGEVRLMAECEHLAGHLELMQGNYAKAGELHEQALAHAEESQHRLLRYQILNNLGLIDMYRGRLEESEARYREALELAEELGRKSMAVQIEMNLGAVRLRQGDCAGAGKRFSSAASKAEKLEFELALQQALLWLGDLALKQGDFQKAADLSRSLVERNGNTRFHDVRAVALSNEARARVALGDLDGTDRLLDEAQRLEEADGNYIGLIDTLSVRAEWRLAQGQETEALEQAQAAVDLVVEHDDVEHAAAVRELHARALLANGRGDEALAMAQEAGEAARRSGVPRDQGWAARTAGVCQRELGQEPKARELFEEALDLARRVGDRALEAAAHADLKSL